MVKPLIISALFAATLGLTGCNNQAEIGAEGPELTGCGISVEHIAPTKTYIRSQFLNIIAVQSFEYGFVHALQNSGKPNNVIQCATNKINDIIDGYNLSVETTLEEALYCPVYQKIQEKGINAFNTFAKDNPKFIQTAPQSITQAFKELAKDPTLAAYKDITLSSDTKKLMFIPESQPIIPPLAKAIASIHKNQLTAGETTQALEGIDKMIKDSGCDLSCMKNNVKELKTPIAQATMTAVMKMSKSITPQLKKSIKECEKKK